MEPKEYPSPIGIPHPVEMALPSHQAGLNPYEAACFNKALPEEGVVMAAGLGGPFEGRAGLVVWEGGDRIGTGGVGEVGLGLLEMELEGATDGAESAEVDGGGGGVGDVWEELAVPDFGAGWLEGGVHS